MTDILAYIWAYIREEIPPARAVAFIGGLLVVPLSLFNAWLADHLPFIAEQVGPDQITAIVLGSVAALVAIIYKWLDGRARYEVAQVEVRGMLEGDGKQAIEALEKEGYLEPVVTRRRRRKRVNADEGAAVLKSVQERV